jgi:hypothetical protein
MGKKIKLNYVCQHLITTLVFEKNAIFPLKIVENYRKLGS